MPGVPIFKTRGIQQTENIYRHSSNVLSDRLSRKPCAWMDEGLETISQLRIFQLTVGN